MTYIPRTRSINGWCPACEIGFGIQIQNDAIVCPICKKKQSLPIIQIGRDLFMCVPCNVTFGRMGDRIPSCHQCHKQLAWSQ